MEDKKRFATKEASDTNRRKKDVTSKFKGKVFHITTEFCSGTSFKALLYKHKMHPVFSSNSTRNVVFY